MCLGRCKIEDSGEDLVAFGRPEAMGNVLKLDETGKCADHEGGCCGSSQGLDGEMLHPKGQLSKQSSTWMVP